MIWSYSFLRDFRNCPFKAYRKYVTRDLPPEDSPALNEGIVVHKALEDHINSKGKTSLDPSLKPFTDPLLRANVQAEVKLGMTRDMVAAGFFGPDEARHLRAPWGRGKIDVLVLDAPTAFIVDWKTGKRREDPHELFIQALLVRANHPEVNRVIGCYAWLKEGLMGKIHDLSVIEPVYKETVATMDEVEALGLAPASERRWPCTPNALCSWCPVADCRFNSNPRIGN